MGRNRLNRRLDYFQNAVVKSNLYGHDEEPFQFSPHSMCKYIDQNFTHDSSEYFVDYPIRLVLY